MVERVGAGLDHQVGHHVGRAGGLGLGQAAVELHVVVLQGGNAGDDALDGLIPLVVVNTVVALHLDDDPFQVPAVFGGGTVVVATSVVDDFLVGGGVVAELMAGGIPAGRTREPAPRDRATHRPRQPGGTDGRKTWREDEP